MNIENQSPSKKRRPTLKLNCIRNLHAESNSIIQKVVVQVACQQNGNVVQSKNVGQPKLKKANSAYTDKILKYQTSVKFYQRYEQLQKLGEGANGVVVRCLKKDGTGQFAVKKTRCQIEQIPNIRQSYNLMKLLNHQGIIKYKSIYISCSQHRAYLVMECFRFPTLCQVKINSEDQIRNIAFKLLDAISYMHRVGLCHRDIKPDNILYDQETRIFKIIDFGVSKEVKLGKHKRLMLTCTGTLNYKAPELFRGGLYDQLIDQWAAGVTIYELITGVKPFYSESVRTTIDNIQQGKLDFSQPVWSKYSPFAKQLIRGLVSPREKRITAEEGKSSLWFQGTKQFYQSFKMPAKKLSGVRFQESLQNTKKGLQFSDNKRIISSDLKKSSLDSVNLQSSQIDESDSQADGHHINNNKQQKDEKDK